MVTHGLPRWEGSKNEQDVGESSEKCLLVVNRCESKRKTSGLGRKESVFFRRQPGKEVSHGGRRAPFLYSMAPPCTAHPKATLILNESSFPLSQRSVLRLTFSPSGAGAAAPRGAGRRCPRPGLCLGPGGKSGLGGPLRAGGRPAAVPPALRGGKGWPNLLVRALRALRRGRLCGGSGWSSRRAWSQARCCLGSQPRPSPPSHIRGRENTKTRSSPAPGPGME